MVGRRTRAGACADDQDGGGAAPQTVSQPFRVDTSQSRQSEIVQVCPDRETFLGRKPIPKRSFLDTCAYLGYVYGERRWRGTDDEFLYTWDALHGEIEVYNARGRHVGVADAVTGGRIKPARKGRRIRV